MPDSKTPTVCPGCGLQLPSSDWPTPDGYNASRECFERYGELTSYTLPLPDPAFPHQHAVDAYAAQHAGPASRPITMFFALAGLYLACERDYSGREVQRAHQFLAQRKRDWPRLRPPASSGTMTVQDVWSATPEAGRKPALQAWARSVWEAWESEHTRVRELVELWLSSQGG